MKELTVSAKIAVDKLGVFKDCDAFKDALAKVKAAIPKYRINQRLTIKQLAQIIGVYTVERLLNRMYGCDSTYTEAQQDLAHKLYYWEDKRYTRIADKLDPYSPVYKKRSNKLTLKHFLRRHDEIMEERRR